MKRNIPNFITLLNLLCGVVALAAIMRQELTTASYLIFLAAIFDFLDGFVARMLHVHSDIGKELDSLADVISFGAAPGLILFSYISQNAPYYFQDTWVVYCLSYSAMLLPIFSALRLAKFNLDASQAYYFKGLPTPASGLLVASLPFIFQLHFLFNVPFFGKIIIVMFNPVFMACLGIVLSVLMVANIPLFSMKFKSLAWKDNIERYIFLIITVLLVCFLSFLAFPFMILFYILLSLAFRHKILQDDHIVVEDEADIVE